MQINTRTMEIRMYATCRTPCKKAKTKKAKKQHIQMPQLIVIVRSTPILTLWP